MICYHKEIAWSPHIGAIYYLESVNKVTKTCTHIPDLLDDVILAKLTEKLIKREKKLLIRYFNVRLTIDWLQNFFLLRKNFSLKNEIRGSFFQKIEFLIARINQAIAFRILAILYRKFLK